MDSNIELMDGIKDVSVYDKIIDAVETVPGVFNLYCMRSRQIGKCIISLDTEVDRGITVNEVHKITQEVEESIKLAIENVRSQKINIICLMRFYTIYFERFV